MSKDLACGLLTVAVAAIYLVATAGLRTSLLGDTVGTAGFPKIIGWGMALTGLVLVGQTLWARFRGRERAGPEGWIPSEAFRNGAGRAALRAGGIVAIVIGYLLLFHPVGYPVAVALLLGATTLYLGAPPTWRIAALAVGGALALWLLFVGVLQVPMPLGPFERGP